MTEMTSTNQNKTLNKVLVAALCSILFGFLILSIFQEKISIDVKYADLIDSLPLIAIFALILVIAPVLEELIFRYWITKPRAIYLAIMVLFVGFIFGHVVIWFICGLLVVFLYWRVNYVKEFIIENQFFTIIFSSVIFGLVHITNYTNFNFWIILPIFILISLGVLLAVLRIKFGIVSSMAAHMVYNLLVMLPYMPPLTSQEEHHFVNGYQISIQKLGIFESDSFNQRSETGVWSCSKCNEQTIINSTFALSEPKALVVFDNGSDFNLIRYNVHIMDSALETTSNLSRLGEDMLQILNYSASRTMGIRTVYELSCFDTGENLWDGISHKQLVVKHVDSLKIVGGKNLTLKMKSLYNESVVCKEHCDTPFIFGINHRNSLQQNLDALASENLLTYTSSRDSVEVVNVSRN